MKSRKISIIIFIALIAATAYYIFRDNSLEEIIRTAMTIDPWFLFLAVCMMFAYVGFQSGNTYVILRQLQQKTGYGKCLQYSFIEFYFSAITPSSTGGQPMQVYYMRKNGISVPTATLTVLVYMLVYQVVFLFYCAFMFIAKHSLLVSVNIYEIRYFLIFGAVASFVTISAVLLVVLSKKTAQSIAAGLVRLLAKLRIVKNKEKLLSSLNKHMDEYEESAKYLKLHPTLVVRLAGLMLMQLTAFFAIPYFIYRSFGMNEYGFFDVVAMQSMVHLSAASLPLPGSVGANENSFYRLFRMIYPSQMIFPALLMSRGISFYGFMLISGAVSAFAHFRMNRTKVES